MLLPTPNNALIVFLRLPVLGKVKTRIAATEGDDQALVIYQHLVSYTLTSASAANVPVLLYYADGLPADVDRNDQYSYHLQVDDELGEKISDALSSVLKSYDKVVIIGSDCPDLSSSIIKSSFDRLEHCDLVLGPATDGGFYLLGCKRFHDSLFDHIQWSTSSVLNQLIKNSAKQKLEIELLEELSDIDTAGDWKKFIDRAS